MKDYMKDSFIKVKDFPKKGPGWNDVTTELLRKVSKDEVESSVYQIPQSVHSALMMLGLKAYMSRVTEEGRIVYIERCTESSFSEYFSLLCQVVHDYTGAPILYLEDGIENIFLEKGGHSYCLEKLITDFYNYPGGIFIASVDTIDCLKEFAGFDYISKNPVAYFYQRVNQLKQKIGFTFLLFASEDERKNLTAHEILMYDEVIRYDEKVLYAQEKE